jgi:hypothetical protein
LGKTLVLSLKPFALTGLFGASDNIQEERNGKRFLFAGGAGMLLLFGAPFFFLHNGNLFL